MRKDLRFKEENVARQLVDLIWADKIMKGILGFNVWLIIFFIILIVVRATGAGDDRCVQNAVANLVLFLLHVLAFWVAAVLIYRRAPPAPAEKGQQAQAQVDGRTEQKK